MIALFASLLARSDEFLKTGPGPIGPQGTPPISVVNVRSLNFSAAFQGDVAELVTPLRGGAENSALFMVQGRPYTAVVVLIPDDSVILTTHSRERGRKTLSVRRLRSLPAAGQAFPLTSRGTASIAVGGTREALPSNQASGDYEGRFFLTVMYQ